MIELKLNSRINYKAMSLKLLTRWMHTIKSSFKKKIIKKNFQRQHIIYDKNINDSINNMHTHVHQNQIYLYCFLWGEKNSRINVERKSFAENKHGMHMLQQTHTQHHWNRKRSQRDGNRIRANERDPFLVFCSVFFRPGDGCSVYTFCSVTVREDRDELGDL